MDEKPIWRKDAPTDICRRHEWVQLDKGWVCVREMNASATTQIVDRSARPSVDPRGGLDRSEFIWWTLILSCFDGEEDDAHPIWGPADIDQIMNLRGEELQRLDQACKRVNGMTAGELDAIRDFSPPSGANGTGSSSPGASSTLTGSPRS